MANKATLDFSGSTKLAEAMAKIPSKSEEVVNRVLLVRGTSFRAVLFRMVSKQETANGLAMLGFRAVLFRMVSKL